MREAGWSLDDPIFYLQDDYVLIHRFGEYYDGYLPCAKEILDEVHAAGVKAGAVEPFQRQSWRKTRRSRGAPPPPENCI